jgi:hypothetical protein
MVYVPVKARHLWRLKSQLPYQDSLGSRHKEVQHILGLQHPKTYRSVQVGPFKDIELPIAKDGLHSPKTLTLLQFAPLFTVEYLEPQ